MNAPPSSNREQQPRFTASLETKLLHERLHRMAIGEIVTYRELSDLIGQDVQNTARSALQSARHFAQRDNQVVTDAVFNVGIKRLSDREVVAGTSLTFKKVRRAVQRGVDRLTAIADFDGLPNDDKLMHNASISALLVMRMMAKSTSVNRITGAVNTTNTGQLPIARTLELFRRPRAAS